MRWNRKKLVPLDQIVGSQGRVDDFDRHFNPIQTHTEARWLDVALVRMSGLPLPPVQLIQVGADYFVVDGHHRISVARAFGQQEIEAAVTVWAVAPSAQENRTTVVPPVTAQTVTGNYRR